MEILKKILITFAIIIVSVFLLFYLLIGLGLSPKLQTLWVTTSMTTMNHKWLATSIISEEKIEKIMKENYIDDSMYDSKIIEIISASGNICEFEKPKKKEEKNEEETVEEIEEKINEIIIKKDNYEAKGYKMLEEGLYLKEVKGSTWRGNIMLVENPMRVNLVDTPNQFKKGWTVKKMTESVGGVAGVNGGGFQDGPNYDSNGGIPEGLLIKNGQLINPRKTNNIVYNMIGINKEGVLVLRHCTADWAIKNGIQQAISFSPYLIVDGEGIIKKGTGGWGIAPRTAIGQKSTGEILFLVIDGRQPTWSIGVDLKVLQDVLLEENCINAAMLDGGSSTVMVYNGEFVNRPSLGHERYINNCWVVK